MSVAALSVTGATPASGGQEEAEQIGWSDTADLSFVFTGGNAEAKTLGFRNTLTRRWVDAALTFDTGAIRAESTQTTRIAIGPSPNEFEVVRRSVTATTAENYFARGRYDHNVSDRALWYAGAGWSRNTFAGIASRYAVVAGLGNTWWDGDAARFRTDYGLSYTFQDEIITDPDTDDTFVGLQLSWSYRRRVTNTATFESALIADENLEARTDFRLDLTNSMAVAMSDRLALKLSWQLQYDNRPSRVEVPLQFPQGTSTGRTIFTELDTLDNLFTLALVVNF